MKEHSEEYMKGYRCGYEVARQKYEKKLPNNKPDKSRLINLAEIPPKIEWLTIDDIGGDYKSFFCSNCHITFDEYEPFKFCPECGGRSSLADMRGKEE
jgi:hypothetical protein